LYEIYLSMVCAILITLYGIWRFVEPGAREVIDWILLISVVTFQAVYFLLAFPLYQDYSWRLYRKVGSDKKFRGIYKNYLIYLGLLKFDFMFSVINIVVSGAAVLQHMLWLSIDLSNLVVQIAFLIMGWQAMSRESNVLGIIFFVLMPFGPAYIIYFFLELHIQNFLGQTYDKKALSIVFIVTGSCALVLRLTLLPFAIIAFRSFGLGLKNLEFLKKQSNLNNDEGEDSSSEDINEVEYDFHETPDDKKKEEKDWNYSEIIRNTHALDDSYVKM